MINAAFLAAAILLSPSLQGAKQMDEHKVVEAVRAEIAKCIARANDTGQGYGPNGAAPVWEIMGYTSAEAFCRARDPFYVRLLAIMEAGEK